MNWTAARFRVSISPAWPTALRTSTATPPLLLPLDLRDWVAGEDLVHCITQVVERLPLSVFPVNSKGCGDEPYPPRLRLALLIYCYAKGIFSSRRIERVADREMAVRYLTANTHLPTTTPSARPGAPTGKPLRRPLWRCWNWPGN